MTARRLASLVLWPFPTMRTWVAFVGGFVAGGLVFVLGFAVVRCGP